MEFSSVMRVAMETAVHRKIFLISLLTLVWRSWFHIGFAQGALTVTTADQMSVREGETISLVCTYSPRTNDPLYFGSLSWQMGNTVLASLACPDRCTETYSNRDRFALNVDKQFSGNLTISEVTIADDNTYECHATTFDGTGTNTVQVVVNVPPTSLTITDDTNSDGYVDWEKVLVIANQPHTMTCETIPGANPAADLVWTTDTVQFTQAGQVESSVGVSKLKVSSREVTFTPVLADHSTRVMCGATHAALDTDMMKTVQLDIQVGPSELMMEYDSDSVDDGDTLILTENLQATITCKSLATRPPAVITWYLDGAEVTSGVGNPEYSPHPSDSRLSDSTSSLLIQPGRANHGQVLRCKATAFGITVDQSVDLQVDGPPDPPYIDALPASFDESRQTTLSCHADNGHPEPSFQWFIGERDLTAFASLVLSTDVDDRIDAESRLLYVPTKEDNGEIMKCSVDQPTLPQPLSVMTDALVVNYCPTSVEVTECPEVVAGSEAHLVCRSDASNPGSNLSWLQGTTMITDNTALRTQFEQTSDPLGTRTSMTYTRNFSQDDYGESFKCCSTLTPLCLTTVCSPACTPNVKYPPSPPTISRNLPSHSIAEGTRDLQITCRSTGNPSPALFWVYETNPGRILDQMDMADGSKVLQFREVQRSHAGTYKCIANNNITPNSEATHQLIVTFPPTILNKAQNRSAANEGSTAELTCTAEGNPSPIVQWERIDNGSIEFWNRTTFNETQMMTDYKSVVTSTLIIRDIRPKTDHGLYQCMAGNSMALDFLVINLTGTSKPDRPGQVTADQARTSAHIIPISWLPGFDGGEAQSFNVKFCLNDTMDCKEIFGIKETKYMIEELEAFSMYVISVSAENTNGRSRESSTILASTAPLPPSSYGVQTSHINGVVTLTADPSAYIPEEVCFRVESESDASCDPDGTCYELDTLLKPEEKVQKSSDQTVNVRTFGRELCSSPESPPDNIQVSRTMPSSVVGAVIGAFIALGLVIVVIALVKRNQKRKGGTKYATATVRSGPEGQTAESGQARPFLSDNPVFDNVAKEEYRLSQHEGRVVNEDGLIYAEVTHNKVHPRGQPPIRTEEETQYAALDFHKMKMLQKNEVDSNKVETPQPEKEALIYENLTPQGKPVMVDC